MQRTVISYHFAGQERQADYYQQERIQARARYEEACPESNIHFQKLKYY